MKERGKRILKSIGEYVLKVLEIVLPIVIKKK